ncbi:nuclear transport factor 2 family protein [Lysobacter sp. F6437]|uniref:nuclear transport factor 2 family protein n=1 Tax=Lysobacter sp. F6437 TaxID=3459296 RepID=UPI00403E1543
MVRWALVLAAACLLAGCARTPPEQALRETMQALRGAVEQRDASAVADHLADDFVGPDGMDRDGARRLAAVAFLRHRDVGVTLGPVDVSVKQDHATVHFTAVLTGGSGRALPDAARLYDVETGWRLEEGDWHLTSARWTPRL